MITTARHDLASTASNVVTLGIAMVSIVAGALGALLLAGWRGSRAPAVPPASAAANDRTQELLHDLMRQQLMSKQQVLVVQVDRRHPDNGITVRWLALDEVKPDYLVIAKDERDSPAAE
jgi:hypothetical protein